MTTTEDVPIDRRTGKAVRLCIDADCPGCGSSERWLIDGESR